MRRAAAAFHPVLGVELSYDAALKITTMCHTSKLGLPGFKTQFKLRSNSSANAESAWFCNEKQGTQCIGPPAKTK